MILWLLYPLQAGSALQRLPVHHVPGGVRDDHGAPDRFFLGPCLIARLRKMRLGQVIREDGPKRTSGKAGTPTMGGILILISIVVPTLLWATSPTSRLDHAPRPIVASRLWASSTTTCKCRAKKRNRGLGAVQAGRPDRDRRSASGRFSSLIRRVARDDHSDVEPPSSRTCYLDLGFFYIPFVMLVITGARTR